MAGTHRHFYERPHAIDWFPVVGVAVAVAFALVLIIAFTSG
jgi:hypothetical protein